MTMTTPPTNQQTTFFAS